MVGYHDNNSSAKTGNGKEGAAVAAEAKKKMINRYASEDKIIYKTKKFGATMSALVMHWMHWLVIYMCV